MPYRNILVRTSEENAKAKMTGDQDIEYTGEVYYNVQMDDHARVIGYEFTSEDIYYGCSCEFKKIRSFKKVEKT